MRRLNLLLLAVASLVLFLMVRNIDWDALVRSFWQGSRFWPLLLIPYGAITLLWTLSWQLILAGREGAPPFRRLYLFRLAGESLNQLTPTASLGGEPFKAQRLNAAGVSWPEATASLVIHKAFMVVSLVFYILISFALIPQVLPGLSQRITLLSYLGTLILAGGAGAFLLVQRRHPCSSVIAFLDRVGLCPALLRARSAECAALDQTLEQFYQRQAGLGLLALACYLAGWALHAVEVWVIFWLLGHPIGLPLALCLDALSQLVAGLGFMIPISLGVQDGGNILLSLGFNLGATLGTGFTILRRFREAFWLLLGLVVAAREK